MLVKVFENSENMLRAEIHDMKEGYRIDYFGPNGKISSENFKNVSIRYVEDAAENWLSGIKILKG